MSVVEKIRGKAGMPAANKLPERVEPVVTQRQINLDRLQADINRLEQEGIPHTVVQTNSGPVAVDLTQPPEREMRIVEMLDQTMLSYANDVRALKDEVTAQFNKIADESESTVNDISKSLDNVAARTREVLDLCQLVTHDVEGAGRRIRETHSAFMITSRNAMAALLNVKEAVAAQHGIKRSDDEIARSEIEALIVKLQKITPSTEYLAELTSMVHDETKEGK